MARHFSTKNNDKFGSGGSFGLKVILTTPPRNTLLPKLPDGELSADRKLPHRN